MIFSSCGKLHKAHEPDNSTYCHCKDSAAAPESITLATGKIIAAVS
jgi:hypothetical protein